MRAVILQHQQDAPAGLLLDGLNDAGVSSETIRVDRGEPLPNPDSVEMAVSLGSEFPADDGERRWVAREIEWLREAGRAGTAVLGLCFGAQALAIALGGGVVRGAARERGWVEVRTRCPGLVPAGPWLTWHDDLIELPRQAEPLAWNDYGPQAYRAGPHLGVQFHPEVTPEIFGGWLASTTEDGLDGEAILARAEHEFPRAAADARRLFTGFVASVRAWPW